MDGRDADKPFLKIESGKSIISVAIGKSVLALQKFEAIEGKRESKILISCGYVK